MAIVNTNELKGTKGIKEIRYPDENVMFRFTSKDYTGYLILNNETGLFEFNPPLDLGASTGTTFEHYQENHGFAVGTPIYHDGISFKKASSSSEDKLAIWVVVEAEDTNNFVAAQSGRFTITAHGLQPGNFYFVGETDGSLTPTEPASYSNPVIYVESTEVFHVLPYRPSTTAVNGGGGGGTGAVSSVFGRIGDVTAQSGDYTASQVGLGNVLNVAQIPASEKGANNGVATLDSGGKILVSQLPVTIQGGIRVVGFWNANNNTPDLSSLSLQDGEAYQVSVAGSTALNGITNWEVYDLAVYSSSVAGNWFKITSSNKVLSVNNQTGNVSLTTTHIPQGTNLYYSDALVSSNPSVVANTSKISASGSINTHSDVDTDTLAPANGQFLGWQDDQWVPMTPPSGITGGNNIGLESGVGLVIEGYPFSPDRIPLWKLIEGSGISINTISGGIQISSTVAGGVSSVNGRVGAVTLDTDDIAEGTVNKYWEEAPLDGRDYVRNSGNWVRDSRVTEVIVVNGTTTIADINNILDAIPRDLKGGYIYLSFEAGSYILNAFYNIVGFRNGTIYVTGGEVSNIADPRLVNINVQNSFFSTNPEDNISIEFKNIGFIWTANYFNPVYYGEGDKNIKFYKCHFDYSSTSNTSSIYSIAARSYNKIYLDENYLIGSGIPSSISLVNEDTLSISRIGSLTTFRDNTSSAAKFDYFYTGRSSVIDDGGNTGADNFTNGLATILSPASMGSSVESVNGQTGIVVLNTDDIDDSTSTNKYANGSISIHSDVDLTGLADGQVLQYNSTSGNFEPYSILESFSFAISDFETALETGLKDVFNFPFDCYLVDIFIAVNPNDLPTGSPFIIDLHGDDNVTIFTTPPSIDSGEQNSLTATVPPVISTNTFNRGDKLYGYIDQVGATNAGSGAKIYMNLKRK